MDFKKDLLTVIKKARVQIDVDITGDSRESLKVTYNNQSYKFSDIRTQKGQNFNEQFVNFVKGLKLIKIAPKKVKEVKETKVTKAK